jgi:peptidoglycan/xylan/chitin deacetylase (PgdA/CDA1 family)
MRVFITILVLAMLLAVTGCGMENMGWNNNALAAHLPEASLSTADGISAKNIRIIANGKAHQGMGLVMDNGGILLPVKGIINLIGGDADLDLESQQMSIVINDTGIVLNINSKLISIDGAEFQLDIPVTLLDNIVFAPLQLFTDHMRIGFGISNDDIYVSSSPATSIPVLLYHHLLPEQKNKTLEENSLVVSTESFDKQMRYLHDKGFYTLTISDMEEFLYNGKGLPERSVMIHFDDGYYSNIVYAYPILKQYGHRATIFFITHYIKELGDNQPGIDDSGPVFTAAKSIPGTEDVFETASHSHDMHKLMEGTYDTVLSRETKENIILDTQKSFEFVGNHSAYAYPRTVYNQNVIDALTEAGIKMAFAAGDTYVTADTNPFELGRISIFRYVDFDAFKEIVNGSFE